MLDRSHFVELFYFVVFDVWKSFSCIAEWPEKATQKKNISVSIWSNITIAVKQMG